MAAALSLSLLSHTLFLKSQVPFPVAQLSRTPIGKSNPKVAKKRDELLATFDTLSSHLQTTFVALSTAYAKCKSAKTKAETATSDENGHGVQTNSVAGPSRGAAHLMFVLGPSANIARARILLTIDGLDVKVWGTRPSEFHTRDEAEGDSEEESDSEGDSEEGSEEFEECCEGEDSEDGEESDSEGSASEEDDGRDDTSSDDGSGPPPSRSPSPSSPMKRSLAPSPESLPSPFVPATPLPVKPTPFTFVHPLPSSSVDPVVAPEPQTTPKPPESSQIPSRSNARASMPPSPREASSASPELSYAEEQMALRAAERLLSRTLMNAWVDGEGDMSSELAPTQTHLFLRAPRRFLHPAWVARQNLTRTLDGVLENYLQDAGAVAPDAVTGKGKTKAKGVRTEGAWIGCKGRSAYEEAEKKRTPFFVQTDAAAAEEENIVEDEEDEEIWWVWDGKIVGFADW